MAIFLPQTAFDQTFDYDAGFFNGYFSNKKLTDLNTAAVSSVITQSDLTVIVDQLDDSMGNYFVLIEGFAILLYLLLIYLLAKLIVERNAASISLVKILGYSNREAGSLYSIATAVVVDVLRCALDLPCNAGDWNPLLCGGASLTDAGDSTDFLVPGIEKQGVKGCGDTNGTGGRFGFLFQRKAESGGCLRCLVLHRSHFAMFCWPWRRY